MAVLCSIIRLEAACQEALFCQTCICRDKGAARNWREPKTGGGWLYIGAGFSAGKGGWKKEPGPLTLKRSTEKQVPKLIGAFRGAMNLQWLHQHSGVVRAVSRWSMILQVWGQKKRMEYGGADSFFYRVKLVLWVGWGRSNLLQYPKKLRCSRLAVAFPNLLHCDFYSLWAF